MVATLKRSMIVLLACVFCLLATKTANAGVAGASNGKTTGVIIAIVAVGALIGVGVYYAVHHGHSLKGCVSPAAGGMQLLNEGDQRTYTLAGDVNGITAGNRVRVSGKKKAGENRQLFVVAKPAKDFGPCR
jgi:hypothetical protein